MQLVVFEVVAAVVVVVVAAERNNLAEAVLAVAHNKIVAVVAVVVHNKIAVAAAAAAVDSLPSFQNLDHLMNQAEVVEEPSPVEGGGSEHWCWLVPLLFFKGERYTRRVFSIF